MTKNFILSVLCIGSVLLQTACSTPQKKKEKQKKPNIIYILADDMGYGDLSCYGQQAFTTPNIDQLASDGIMFTRHYTGCTVCAPSRASLLTGKHTGHTSVRVNLDNLVDDSEPTIASVLKDAGYKTAHIGKWGLGSPPPYNDPKKKGFDESYGYINMWHAHNYFPEFLIRDGAKEYIEGNVVGDYLAMKTWDGEMPEGVGVAVERAHYSPDLFEDDALRFIEECKDTSFFLYLASTIPHANNEADNGMEIPDYGKFAKMDWPEPEKGFAAMITRLDSTVGIIRAKLEKLELSENTLIIFASDNGPHIEGGHSVNFFDSNGSLRGHKRDLYEGGIRTPMIACWPGKIQPGSKTDHISAFWDVLPTFCDLVDSPLPDDTDGISFLPILLGNKEAQKEHEFLYWEFYEDNGKQAVVMGNYKGVLLNLREKPVFELYDLSKDMSETHNIADEHPDIVEKMKIIMKESHGAFFVPLYEYSKWYPKDLVREF